MYNKLFTKILDSSIWLESCPTRIVWLTFIAVMDESGFAQFAAVRNVAHRARVTVEEAQEAVRVLEAPDPESSDPDNDGRRLERVPGGWMVLNSEKHRKLVTRAVIQEQTRERVRQHRQKSQPVIVGNASVTQGNANPNHVTPSEAEAEARSEEKRQEPRLRVSVPMNGTLDDDIAERAGRFCERYAELYPMHRRGARYLPKPTLDWTKACELVSVWDDARLERLAVVFLKTDHEFAASGSRTIGQFAALASWCDDRLREVEATA